MVGQIIVSWDEYADPTYNKDGNPIFEETVNRRLYFNQDAEAQAKFDELKNTPNRFNITLMRVERYCSTSN